MKYILLFLMLFLAGFDAHAKMIASGWDHVCELSDGGTVKCWGNNGYGQLGIGVTGADQASPQDVPNLGNVIALSAGGYHTCALLQGRTVKCWGYNDYGQLGIGVAGADQPSPQEVPNLGNVIALSAGDYHTCALLQGGTVKCWGYNGEGELGIGVAGADQASPQDVPNLGNVIALSAGDYHTCVLLQGGTVKCWGYNDYGQLGIGVTGADQASPQDVPNLGNVTALSAGGYHNLRLRTSRISALPPPSVPAATTPAPCSRAARSSAGVITATASSASVSPAPINRRPRTCPLPGTFKASVQVMHIPVRGSFHSTPVNVNCTAGEPTTGGNLATEQSRGINLRRSSSLAAPRSLLSGPAAAARRSWAPLHAGARIAAASSGPVGSVPLAFRRQRQASRRLSALPLAQAMPVRSRPTARCPAPATLFTASWATGCLVTRPCRVWSARCLPTASSEALSPAGLSLAGHA